MLKGGTILAACSAFYSGREGFAAAGEQIVILGKGECAIWKGKRG